MFSRSRHNNFDAPIKDTEITVRFARLSLIVFTVAVSLTVLGRILFEQGLPYAPDPGAFFAMTSKLADAMLGNVPWTQALKAVPDRTVTYVFPVSALAALTGFRSPEFYMTVAWVLYVLPLPFLYLSLVRAFRTACLVDYAVAGLFLAVTPILTLGVLYFTDVPAFSIAVAGLSLLAHGLQRLSTRMMAFGFFVLAMAVTVRFTNAVPYLMAILLMFSIMWEQLKVARFHILKALAIAIGAIVIAEAVFRFDMAFVTLIKLGQNLQNTIWKYGNGNIEYGVDNLFAFRFWNFLAAFALWFFPFIVVLVMGLVSGRSIIFNKQEHRRLWFVLAGFLGLVADCAYAASFMILNTRYIIPALLIILPILAMTAITKMAGKILAVLCLIFCMDVLYFHWGEHGQSAPLSTAIARAASRVHAGWVAPIGVVATRNKIDITSNLVNTLLAAGAESKPVSVEVLSLNSPLFQEGHLRYYLIYMSSTSDIMKRAYQNIQISGAHPGEFRIPEVYNRFVSRNALAFANADFIIAPIDDDRPGKYTSFWSEKGLLEKVNQETSKKREAQIGLSIYTTLLGGLKTKNGIVPVRYNVYRVANPKVWSVVVKQHFCTQSGVNDPNFSLWCGMAKLEENGHIDIPVSPASLAKAAKIIEVPSVGHVLKIDLKWSPQTGFSRVFAHFVPQPSSSEACPFFAVDHKIWEKWNMEDYVIFPVERLQNIHECKYVLNVGVHVDLIKENVFNAAQYVNALAQNPNHG